MDMYEYLYSIANNDRLIDLLVLHKYGIITEKEYEELQLMLKSREAEDIAILFNLLDAETGLTAEEEQAAIDRIQITLPENNSWRMPPRWHYNTLVALLAVVMAVVVFWVYPPRTASHNELTAPVAVQPPVVNDTDVMLTLPGGKMVALGTDIDGKIAGVQGTVVHHQNDNLLKWEAPLNNEGMIQYHTLTTPRLKMQQLALPDGSNVWLNAQSVLRFPGRFSGETREVELTGEAYFEIAAAADRPFVIKAGKQIVKVLGTQLNVEAYEGSRHITTLLTGKVTVDDEDEQVRLLPGQQVLAGPDEKLRVTRLAVPDEVIAWKNNNFNFNNLTLQQTLKQLERWYGVAVVYRKNVSTVDWHFGGIVSRKIKLEDLVRLLSDAADNRVQLELSGSTITVS